MNSEKNDCSEKSLKSLLAGRPEFDLNEILQDPILLGSFESYLTKSWAQENLLFIEAMNQLRHDAVETSKDVEEIFKRYVSFLKTINRIEIYHNINSIYSTFIAFNAPLELNVKTQELVKERILTIHWAIFTQDQALDILKETEKEVLEMLVSLH